MKTKVQVGSDSAMVFDFFASQPGDTGVDVDQETFDRWRRIDGEWAGMQRELEALLEANPDIELGNREPSPEIDDLEEAAQ